MLRLSLFLSGLASFLYFLAPQNFPDLAPSGEKVLGVKSINQVVNRETVYTAILAYCLDEGHLPSDLNQLYEKELSPERRIDLNTLYRLNSTDPNSCEFNLETI